MRKKEVLSLSLWSVLIGSLLGLWIACSDEQSGGSKPDDPIGGEEKISDSFKCKLSIKSLDEDGKEDPVRGFNLEVTVFLYDGGSSAATLIQDYVFESGIAPYRDVASRVFDKSFNVLQIETDLLSAKIRSKDKMAVIYRKYEPGFSKLMSCN